MSRRRRKKRPETTDNSRLGYKENRLKARTEGQREFIYKIKDHTVTLCSGPPGSGKTHIAIALGVQALKNGLVNRLLLTRPAVEASMSLGFLPGDLMQKLSPFLVPLMDELSYYMDAKLVSKLIEEKIIEICPVGFFRGRTLKNTYVIVDEAQNCVLYELRTLLTRLGEGSKMILVGDTRQSDIDNSGFRTLMRMMEGIEDLAIHKFTYEDVVRHPLVVRIEERFEDAASS